MVKISSNDVIGILRKYEVAGDENVPRHVSMLNVTNPTLTSTMAGFRFAKRQYYIVYDDTADDDIEFITDQIRSDRQDVIGDMVANPSDSTKTYATPYKGKEVYLYAVKSPKVRLDQELVERYPDLSRSTWQKHVKAGHVLVNGKEILVPKFEIIKSDDIAVSLPDAIDFSKSSLPIVYIDDNVIVINKPVGVLSHSKGALNDEFTVADFFGRYSTYNSETNRPGIVHRLDRDTSGIMIGARNQETATLLQKQFADRKTKKVYMAVLDGIPKLPKAQLNLPIGRNPAAPSTFKVDTKGKSAITKYDVLEENGHLALVRLQPLTGRTHQLRVHMKYLNTPILGDRVYGKASDRLYLHAKSLEITIPVGDRRTFEAPVPPEFFEKLSQGK
jgi:23S rRNA pseudouridine1911/1915/1917 synthase